jgi:NAD-specific glutamate dehydrogenase
MPKHNIKKHIRLDFDEKHFSSISKAIINGRTGDLVNDDFSDLFTKDGLSVHPGFLHNVDKFQKFMKKSGINLKYLSTEDAKKRTRKIT